LLTANIHVGSSTRLWLGVVDAAERHAVNLLCFPGGRVQTGRDAEAQRNVLYDLMSPALLDGLVSWSSTITGSFEPAEFTAFHQRYRALPMVSLTQPLAGTPTLSVDSYEGMCAAVTHLIAVHGYRRLAFIRGPADHYYAQERYQAYLDTLQAYGIPFDPALVTPPCAFELEAGAEAMQSLLDTAGLRPGLDLHAVVAVSDLLALGALKALHARGVQVPRDLALVGFNNSKEGRLATPPITSVAMAFYEQGSRAVDMVLAQRDGQDVPAQVMLRSRLAVHQSCGCPSGAVAGAAVGPLEARPDGPAPFLPALRPAVLSAMEAAFGPPGVAAPEVSGIFDAFADDLAGEAEGRFLAALEQAAAGDGEAGAWQSVLSALRGGVLPHLGRAASYRAEDLIGQGRVLIGEVAQRAQAYQQLQADRHAAILREIGQELITAFDIASLADVLAERLPELGIASCYLSLYERPATPLDRSRLVLAYTEHGRVPLAPEGQSFPSRQLVPDDQWPRQRRYSMVVEPLFFRQDQLGFVLFEIGPRDPSVYEVLRGYISSAVKGALLAQELNQARLAAEKANQIKTRLLANVSHELRTPLKIILEHTGRVMAGDGEPQVLQHKLQHIRHSAEHQLRLINDLLDLSRAEIDELDLFPELLDPRALLEETFHSFAGQPEGAGSVAWRLALPEQLPRIAADPVRLRQILLNLLSNAAKFTERGEITLGAEVAPPRLHLWIADTGVGIAPARQERIFEPFVTAEHSHPAQRSGIGLGLSITRRLVALHDGVLEISSEPGKGSTFHVYLPLPAEPEPPAAAEAGQPLLLVISTSHEVAEEIVVFSRRQGLGFYQLQPGDNLEQVLARVQPAALAWDMVEATPQDWATIRRLRQHPHWGQMPFIMYGQGRADEAGLDLGLTGFVTKPVSPQTLGETVGAALRAGAAGPVLIVDDDPAIRALHTEIAARALPDYPIQVAGDGDEAVELMRDTVPSLVLLDLIMPGMEGTDVLDWMRADPRLRQVPVIILSSKLLTFDDIKRLEQHAQVILQSKGILSDEETIATLRRVLFEGEALSPYTSALVKRALAYLHQEYRRTIARWELAEAAGVSEDYLSRVFSRELGLSPWEYLNRYRIFQAKELLRTTAASVSAIAEQVGFHDSKYFSRVFRNLTGVGPKEFRERPDT